MRVFFDDQIFSSQTRGGISNYFVNIAREFGKCERLGVEVVGFPFFTKNEHLIESGKGRRIPLTVLQRMPVYRALNRTRGALRSARRTTRPEVVHRTYYFDGAWQRGGPIRNVVTVHDMTPELFPAAFPQGSPHARKAVNIFNADAIACVSETTKKDLLRFYPDLQAPVIVTPLGVSPKFNVGASEEGRHGGYFLYVGARGGYKNFEQLLQALSLLELDFPWELVLVGGGVISPDEAARFKGLGLANRIRQVNPTDAELVNVYRGAICLVFPSRYEGFGLPTVEAMASGCPTLLSETPALMEVGGSASLYFALDDPEALARQMTAIACDQGLRGGLRERGIDRAAMYSWSRTATLTEMCYRAALAQ